MGLHFSQFYPQTDIDQGKPQRALEIAKASGQYKEEGWRIRKDGSQFWASVTIEALYDEHGIPAGFSKITRDLTDRRNAEQQLRASEAKFSTAFLSSPLAVTIATLDEGRYIDFNDAFLRILGLKREALIGRTSAEVNIWCDPEDRSKMVARLQKEGRVRSFETCFNSVSEGRRDILVFAELIHLEGTPCILAVAEDVTEAKRQRKLERQIHQVEALGRLAGGVAHDFNNVLSVILGYCDLLLDRITSEDSSHNFIEQIRLASHSAADLTRQLLAFGRQQVMQTKVIQLNDVILNMGDMVQRLIGEDIEIMTRLSSLAWPVEVDPSQMQQVLMNLVINARDAMPAGGKLTIETDNIFNGDKTLAEHSQVTPGDYVRLAVTDNGDGMDDITKERIFEPFFTTKELGKGTGLGLATVYGIVKQSGGFIWVYSEKNHGTTFKIYLPRTYASMPREAPIETSQETMRGTETILVLEDNGQLRELAVVFLESLGYTVFEAGGPEKAIEIARTCPRPIHLLLTDVVLPRMSGRVVAEHVQKIRPDTRVLFVSGYTDDVMIRHGILNAGVPFLQKPYSREALNAKVRSVLRGQPDSEQDRTSA